MLSQLFSLLSRKKSPEQSTSPSLKPSGSSASSHPPSLGLLNKANWMAKATDQIKQDEGLVLHAYQDHLGFWTLGYGRLIDKRKGGRISEDEALYLLKNDVNERAKALSDALPFWADLDDARKGALLNMSFQLGMAGLLKFKNTLAFIEAGDYENAAANMLKSKWAQQTPARAKRVSEQIRTGQWQYGSR